MKALGYLALALAVMFTCVAGFAVSKAWWTECTRVHPAWFCVIY